MTVTMKMVVMMVTIRYRSMIHRVFNSPPLHQRTYGLCTVQKVKYFSANQTRVYCISAPTFLIKKKLKKGRSPCSADDNTKITLPSLFFFPLWLAGRAPLNRFITPTLGQACSSRASSISHLVSFRLIPPCEARWLGCYSVCFISFSDLRSALRLPPAHDGPHGGPGSPFSICRVPGQGR